jgi:hypothetical protein
VGSDSVGWPITSRVLGWGMRFPTTGCQVRVRDMDPITRNALTLSLEGWLADFQVARRVFELPEGVRPLIIPSQRPPVGWMSHPLWRAR